MKAIVVREFGPPEVLRTEDAATPQPAAGQVLVRIKAAGVNPADTYVRSGTYAVKPPLPYTPGSDGAGVVEAVGEGVKRVKPGDRVFTARSVTGTYAELPSRWKAKCCRCPSVFRLRRVRAYLCPTGQPTGRWSSSRIRARPRRFWCTARVVAWASPRCRLPRPRE